MPYLRVKQVADGVHLVSTGLVNWTLLTDGPDVTLVDAGYPGDHERVVASLEAIGRTPRDLAGVVVTHAHVDHIGSLPRLLADTDVPVFLSEQETHHARREYLQQATEKGIALAALRNPRFLAWAAQILLLGAKSQAPVPDPRPCTDGVPLDLPGQPVPVATPGHTSGHNAYHLPHAGAVITGDALVTGHATTRRQGPQLLDPVFQHDLDGTHATLDAIAALDGDLVLPGHGPAWRGDLASAVEFARAT